MRVRRRTSGSRSTGLFAWFRPAEWYGAAKSRFRGDDPDAWLERAGGLATGETAQVSTHAEPSFEPGSPPDPPSGQPGLRARAVRLYRRAPRAWLLAGTFLATWLGGYAIAALVLFPAPFFTSEFAVPNLIGVPESTAVAQLTAAGLPPAELTYEQHAFAERGHVVWQDPPADVMVSEITTVQLVISNGPPRIPVPDVSGFETGLATHLLEAAGLTVGRIENVQTAVPRNVTVNTRPAPGATLLPGGSVTLVVSVGAPNVPIPNLVGLTRDQARDTLEAVGLALGDFEWRLSSAQPPEHIIEQRPAANTLAAAGTAVTVFIARRPR